MSLFHLWNLFDSLAEWKILGLKYFPLRFLKAFSTVFQFTMLLLRSSVTLKYLCLKVYAFFFVFSVLKFRNDWHLYGYICIYLQALSGQFQSKTNPTFLGKNFSLIFRQKNFLKQFFESIHAFIFFPIFSFQILNLSNSILHVSFLSSLVLFTF